MIADCRKGGYAENLSRKTNVARWGPAVSDFRTQPRQPRPNGEASPTDYAVWSLPQSGCDQSRCSARAISRFTPNRIRARAHLALLCSTAGMQRRYSTGQILKLNFFKSRFAHHGRESLL